MKFHKINRKSSSWSGGESEEFFIFPGTASYGEKNFKIRVSKASIDKVPSEFTNLPNMRRFLIPLDNDIDLTHNGDDIRIMQYETFEFSGEDKVISYSEGSDLNLMVEDSIEASMQYVDFDDALEIEDDFDFDRMYFIYSLSDDLKLRCASNFINLDEDDMASAVFSDKCRIEIKGPDDDYTNEIILIRVKL